MLLKLRWDVEGMAEGDIAAAADAGELYILSMCSLYNHPPEQQFRLCECDEMKAGNFVKPIQGEYMSNARLQFQWLCRVRRPCKVRMCGPQLG